MTEAPTETQTMSMRAEQAVLGGLIINNDAMDRIVDLNAGHFHHQDHKLIFSEMRAQILANQTADALTVASALGQKLPGNLPKKTARALLDIENKDYVPIIRNPNHFLHV